MRKHFYLHAFFHYFYKFWQFASILVRLGAFSLFWMYSTILHCLLQYASVLDSRR